jgi:DNA topoisomerase-1
VFSGKYGPYVKCGKVNVSLPEDITPEAITIEQAVELIKAKGGGPDEASSKGKKAKKAAGKKASPKESKVTKDGADDEKSAAAKVPKAAQVKTKTRSAAKKAPTVTR